MLTPLDIIGPDGLIANRVSRYEQREEQLEMVRHVQRAIGEKRHLAVEAGTGVGKSFAYLIPAILHTTRRQNEGIEEPPVGGESVSGTDEEERLPVVVARMQ